MARRRWRIPSDVVERAHKLYDEISTRRRSGELSAPEAFGEFIKGIGDDSWRIDQVSRFLERLSGPKSLDQLIAAAESRIWAERAGRAKHHIVEVQRKSRHPLANSKRFSPALLRGRTNTVRIRDLARREIVAFYSSFSEAYGTTPREYLRGKSWDEQYEFGLQVLRDAGELK